LGGSGFRVARSPKGSHATLHPQFASPANLAVCLSGLANRRKQPERYAPVANFWKNIISIKLFLLFLSKNSKNKLI